MVYRQINPDMKKQAFQLLEGGWEMSKITDALGVSTKSIPRWHNNSNIHCHVNPPSALHGRHRIFTSNVIGELYKLMQESLLDIYERGSFVFLLHLKRLHSFYIH
jgi:hypothetical protein